MIYKAVNTDRGEKTSVVLDTPYVLEAKHTVIIPALCLGTIPHGVHLESSCSGAACFVMLIGEPDLIVSHNLIVVPRPVPEGDVVTYVFNLSNSQLRIRKGEVISRLIRMLGTSWI
jgi:hypothetical protein